MLPHTASTVDAKREPAAVERVAASIAHEIANLLTVVLAHAELAELTGQAGPDGAKSNLDAIREASNRAAALTADLREFAGKGEAFRPSSLRLGPVAESVPGLVSALLGRDWSCETALGEDVAVQAHLGRIEHVALLAAAAAKASFPRGGRFVVGLEASVASSKPVAVLRFSASSGDGASADPGAREAVDVRLALLRRAAERNGGRLRVEEAAGTFVVSVELPQVSG